MTSLHPSPRVVDQVAEVLLVHDGALSRSAARRRAIELLVRVGVPQPARRAGDYPHQWSGGMRQRAMIAVAMANRPRLLVADEPTTALDVTIQAQILAVLRQARDEVGAATVLITHDLGVVAQLADRVAGRYRAEVGARRVSDLLDLVGPDPADPPSGCRSRTRCQKASPVCAEEVPVLAPRPGSQQPCACLFSAATDLRPAGQPG